MGESGDEMRRMGAGNKAKWGIGMCGISVKMCRMQENKVMMREIKWGCSE